MCVVFFCFKQKTAYEMRISDWSSDVCSSDLQVDGVAMGAVDQQIELFRQQPGFGGAARGAPFAFGHAGTGFLQPIGQQDDSHRGQQEGAGNGGFEGFDIPLPRKKKRSEEHTSELQSLMRLSYAVFCFKKKN